jgi:hypothetical protein
MVALRWEAYHLKDWMDWEAHVGMRMRVVGWTEKGNGRRTAIGNEPEIGGAKGPPGESEQVQVPKIRMQPCIRRGILQHLPQPLPPTGMHDLPAWIL